MQHRKSSRQGWKSPPTGPNSMVRAARRPLAPGDYLALVATPVSWWPDSAPRASTQEYGRQAHWTRRRLPPLGSEAPWALRWRSSHHASPQAITDMTYPTYSMQPLPPTSPVRSISSRAFTSGSSVGRVATWCSHLLRHRAGEPSHQPLPLVRVVPAQAQLLRGETHPPAVPKP